MASLLPFQQLRTNTVNFFMRRNQAELWKTIRSVSKAGEKKGRRTTRQPERPLHRFYRIGASPIGARFPGLNAPLKAIEEQTPVQIQEQSEEEIKTQLASVRTTLEEQPKRKKRGVREKLHPLERGFSGAQLVGQKLGPPPPANGNTFEDFETYCLELNRTATMTSVFGRVHTMSALVITGNGRGLAGYAVGKAPLHRTTTAIVNGINMASRKLFFVELLEGRTIYQDFYAECGKTRIFAQRRPAGFGLVCHPRLIKICQAIGIKDIFVRVESSTRNYLALTHAFCTGLLNQETHQALSERTGLHVVEMAAERNFFPQVVASPVLRAVKTDDAVLPIERLSLDEFYGEGRYPLKKPSRRPFYADEPNHLVAEWHKWPFRNQEKAKIRLMADGVVDRWTRDNRRDWAKRFHREAVAGVRAVPQGIGLPVSAPKSTKD